MGPLAGVGLGIGDGPVGPGPGPQVPEPVLHRHRVAGELVDRAGDALLPRPRGGDPGQGLVDGGGALQVGHRRRQLLVDRRQLGVDPPQLGRPGPFPAVEGGVLQGAAGLVGQDLEEELLVGGGFGGGADHQPAPVAAQAAQGEGPTPPGAGDVDRPVVGPEAQQRRRQRLPQAARGMPEPLGPGAAGAVGIGRREVGALGGAGPEGSDGGDGQAEDLVLVAALRHHHRQHEQAVEVRDLLPQPDDVSPWHCSHLTLTGSRHASPPAGFGFGARHPGYAVRSRCEVEEPAWSSICQVGAGRGPDLSVSGSARCRREGSGDATGKP